VRVLGKNTQKGENWVIVKRTTYVAIATLVAMLVLAPAALAQDLVEGEDDVLAAEREATVVEHGELEQIAGQPLPKQVPDEPIDEPGGPAPKEGTQPKGGSLPKSGGVMTSSALLLPAAALLLGSGVLGYAVLRRRN
jgi:hypothetical protein